MLMLKTLPSAAGETAGVGDKRPVSCRAAKSAGEISPSTFRMAAFEVILHQCNTGKLGGRHSGAAHP